MFAAWRDRIKKEKHFYRRIHGMSNRMEADKRERVLMGMYGSSQGISTLALIIVAAFEIMMLGYTTINAELYGPYLLKYRLFYVSLLAVAVISIILNEFV